MSVLTPSAPFVHGMALYGSDEEFLDAFVPFCRAGLERGEPTVVRIEPHKASLLRDALDAGHDITFADYDDQYADPPSALAAALDIAGGSMDAGQMRLVGELPPMVGLSRDAWVRYEAAATHVLRHHPVLAMCPFDRRQMPESLTEEMLRIHHVVLSSEGVPQPNPRVETPHEFLAAERTLVRDPLEAGSPTFTLTDPSPATVRQALAHLAHDMRVPEKRTGDLLLAASEVVTNALLHGERPVHVASWARPGRVVVAVRDGGGGPDDPFAGLLPRGGTREGGRGLWITHQVCPEVAMSHDSEGFTIRLAVGTPEVLTAH